MFLENMIWMLLPTLTCEERNCESHGCCLCSQMPDLTLQDSEDQPYFSLWLLELTRWKQNQIPHLCYCSPDTMGPIDLQISKAFYISNFFFFLIKSLCWENIVSTLHCLPCHRQKRSPVPQATYRKRWKAIKRKFMNSTYRKKKKKKLSFH